MALSLRRRANFAEIARRAHAKPNILCGWPLNGPKMVSCGFKTASRWPRSGLGMASKGVRTPGESSQEGRRWV